MRLLCLLLLFAPLAASAQDGFHPRLKHRNARYARLDRTLDEPGDASQAVRSDLVRVRLDDRVGDLEELRRSTAARKVPPRATRHARPVPRELAGEDDARQWFVAALPRHRLGAELRRFRDLAGDVDELARWRDDRVRFGPLRGPRETIVQERPDEDAERYLDEREYEIRGDRKLDREVEAQDTERDLEESAERDEDRQLEGRREPERDEPRDEGRAEAQSHAEDERAEERAAEAEAERQIQQEDAQDEE